MQGMATPIPYLGDDGSRGLANADFRSRLAHGPDRQQVRRRRDRRRRRAGEDACENVLPRCRVAPNSHCQFDRFVEAKAERGVGHLAGRRRDEAAIQPSNALAACYGGHRGRKAELLATLHGCELLPHHGRLRPVHRRLRSDTGRADKPEIQRQLRIRGPALRRRHPRP